jgi:LPS-assembly protein
MPGRPLKRLRIKQRRQVLSPTRFNLAYNLAMRSNPTSLFIAAMAFGIAPGFVYAQNASGSAGQTSSPSTRIAPVVATPSNRAYQSVLMAQLLGPAQPEIRQTPPTVPATPLPPLPSTSPPLSTNSAPPVSAQVGKPASAPPTAQGQAARVLATPARTAPVRNNIVLDADTVEQGDTSGVIIATGNVVATNAGRVVRANRLVYDQNSGVVTATGNVTVVEADGSTTVAEQLTLDDALNTGVINNFAARFPDGSVVAANGAVRRAGDRNFLTRAIYTACQVCQDGKSKPTWAVRARRAMQDQRSETLVYNDVVLEIKGVPILYVPYFQHGDPSVGRRSGLLQPKPGESSRMGLFWEQPYLWVIDPYSELTIAPIITQRVNPILQLDYRRKFYSGSLEVRTSGTYERFFNKEEKFGEADYRSYIFAEGRFEIAEGWDWGLGVESASDEGYTTRYGLPQYGTKAESETSPIIRAFPARLLSQLYLEGVHDRQFLRILTLKIQDIGGFERRKAVPFVAPLVEGEKSWSIGPMNGQLRARGSGVYLSRGGSRLDSGRVSGTLDWQGRSVFGPGLVVQSEAMARTDYFNYKNTQSVGRLTDSESFSRTLGAAGVTVSWPLQRLGQNLNWTIEPKLSVVYASDANEQARVIQEETAAFELDSTGLFRLDGASGFDQWEAGGRVTAGVKFSVETADINDAPSRASLFVGLRQRSESNPFAARSSNLDKKTSDWMTEVELAHRNNFSLTGRVRLDSDTGKLVRAEVASRLSFWRFESNVRYHELPKSVVGPDRVNREVEGTFKFRLNKNFTAFSSTQYDILNKVALRAWHGITYQDDCTELRLFYEETKVNFRFIEPGRSIRFQFALKTLGTLSDQPFD